MRAILTAISGTAGRALVSAHALAACLLALMGYGPALVQGLLLTCVWFITAALAFMALALLTHFLDAAEPVPAPATEETNDA